MPADGDQLLTGEEQQMNSATRPVLAPRPSHVPPELVVDFDFYNIPGAREDAHLAWKRLQSGPRIFWTPRNGGHWVATRGEDIKELQMNWELFSYRGATIPRGSTPALPVESDPPEHTAYRSMISPLFAPATLKGAEAIARPLAIRLIDGLKPRGQCEFRKDLALEVPIAVFLHLVDLPFEARHTLLPLAEDRFRSPDAAKRDASKAGILRFLENTIKERRARPGNDFISRILHSNVRVGDRPITDEELQHNLASVMSGGLDTVAGAMGFAIRFLAQHPEHRRQLLQEPSLIPKAVDELMRRHGISGTARLLARDVVFRGVRLCKGEQILNPNLLYGLDEDIFPNALEVDFRRPNAAAHAAFGNGPHRCPGANLARLELRIVLEEWLARIPDFRLDPDRPPVMRTGLANVIEELPLLWDVASIN
jgi:cytochrome P450